MWLGLNIKKEKLVIGVFYVSKKLEFNSSPTLNCYVKTISQNVICFVKGLSSILVN